MKKYNFKKAIEEWEYKKEGIIILIKQILTSDTRYMSFEIINGDALLSKCVLEISLQPFSVIEANTQIKKLLSTAVTESLNPIKTANFALSDIVNNYSCNALFIANRLELAEMQNEIVEELFQLYLGDINYKFKKRKEKLDKETKLLKRLEEVIKEHKRSLK